VGRLASYDTSNPDSTQPSRKAKPQDCLTATEEALQSWGKEAIDTSNEILAETVSDSIQHARPKAAVAESIFSVLDDITTCMCIVDRRALWEDLTMSRLNLGVKPLRQS
jgi:hypothetical protein